MFMMKQLHTYGTLQRHGTMLMIVLASHALHPGMWSSSLKALAFLVIHSLSIGIEISKLFLMLQVSLRPMRTVSSKRHGMHGLALTRISVNLCSLVMMTIGRIAMLLQSGSPMRKPATPTSWTIRWITFGTASTPVSCTSNNTAPRSQLKVTTASSTLAHHLRTCATTWELTEGSSRWECSTSMLAATRSTLTASWSTLPLGTRRLAPMQSSLPTEVAVRTDMWVSLTTLSSSWHRTAWLR